MGPYEVVISGIGGHFPECDHLATFQKRLQNGDNLVTLDGSRWIPGTYGVDAHSGKTTNVNHFDYTFFGVHRSVTNITDPCARKIMERTFEAIVDAGLHPRDLSGSNTCVFICTMNPEHESVFLDALQTKNNSGIIGASRSMVANRISFFFNLTGHSVAHDSWIWGGLGLERAYNSIRSGECDAALVGGCSLAMHAEMSRMLDQMGVLSTDGISRPFDANGNGLVRSEAQVVFLLQRADLAKRSYATVLGATGGAIGPRSGNILIPSAKALTNVVRDLYKTSGIDPQQVKYVECQGSGYQPVDVAELVGLGEVFCNDRQGPLLVGSVQGNVGHTEAACGLVSTSKVITIMETGVVPATLHHETPHPEIDPLCDGRIKVVTEKSKIEISNDSIFAVSGVSFGGEVSHVILRAGGKEKKINKDDNLPRLVALSSRTSEGLTRMLNEIQNSPFDPEYYALIHNVFRQPIKNQNFRGYTICPPPENFRSKVSKGDEVKRPLWFVFSGMGSQWPGMGRDLLKFPAFRDTIERCQRALDHTGTDLFKIMTSTDSSNFDDIITCFLGISAIQIGLVNLLRQLGIKPDGYIGHSLGEQSCAYIDDCLDEEQTILAAYARGKASKDSQLIEGMMAAIGKGNSEMQNILPPTIDVACHNSAESCTISGPKKDVEIFVEELNSKKIFARLVNVANIAYHSRYIKSAAPSLKKSLEKIIPEPKERTSRWISSSVPEDRWDTQEARFCSAEYMTNNLTHSVLFEEAFKVVPENAIILEIAPHGLLQAILRRSTPKGSINLSLTQRGASDGVLCFLKAIGELYAEGVEMNIAGLYPPVEFPVSRGTPSLASLTSWFHDEDLFTMVDCLVARTTELSAMVNSDTPFTIVQGLKLCSPSHLLMLVWKAVASSNRMDPNKVRIIFKNIEFFEPIEIPSEGIINLYIGVQIETKGFQVATQKGVVLSGKAIIDPNEYIFNEAFKVTDRIEEESKQTEPIRLQAHDIYSDLGARGQEYLPEMQQISHIDITEKEWIVHIEDNISWESLFTSTIQAAQLNLGESGQEILYPKSIRSMSIDPIKYRASHPHGVELLLRAQANMITTNGFYVEGFYMAPFEFESRSPQIRASVPLFVPLGKKNELSTEIMWTAAVHLIGEEQPWLNTIYLLELKSTSGSNGDINFDLVSFENCANKLGFKIRHLTFQVNGVPPPVALSEMSIGSLVVCGSDSASSATKFLDGARAMVLLKLTGTGMLPAELNHMAILCRSGSWVLLRHRVGPSDPKVVHVSGIEIPDVRLSEKSTVLVWQSGINKEAIKHIADRMAETLNGILFRLFFILDPKAPKFSLNLPIYREQLDLGLRVNVYQTGSWGTVLDQTVPENVGLPLTFESQLLSAISTKSVGCTEIHYWGMHEINLKQKRRTEVVLDYTGENVDGRVMGIAVARNGKPIADPVLQWPLPDGWSLEDGATVPIAYCQSFLALKVLCNIRRDEKVMVLNAAGPEEQAFIRTALQSKCRVFAVVGNDFQESTLKKSLSEIVSSDLEIIKTTCKDIYIGVRALSNVRELDVLVTRKASDLSLGFLSMVTYNGRIVYLGNPNPNTREIIGTYHFNRSTAMYGVSAGSVLAMSDSYKKTLAEVMRENLGSGTVKPLERDVLPASSDNISWLEGSTAPRKMVRQVKQSTMHFSCNPGKTYLIAGGSLIQNLTLVTWLVRRGASHVVVAGKEASKPLQRRARFFPNTKVYSESDVTSALKKAHSVGKLDLALFVVQGFEAEEAARHIQEFRNDCGSTLIVINDSEHMPDCVIHACEQIEGMGVRTLVSAGVAKKAVSTRLLDWMLRSGNEQQVTVRNIHEARRSAESAIRLLDVLPKTVNSLAALVRSLLEYPRLVELPSVGPLSRDAKEVFPLYAIAGFGSCTCDTLQSLASHLLVPLMSVHLPKRVTSVQQIAIEIAEDIRSRQPKGPYSVFGSDWSTVLAQQVSIELRKQGEVVQLFLLDADPETLAKDAKELQARSDADLLLIESTLGMNPYSKTHRILASSSSWDERLSVILPLMVSNTEIRKAATDSLCFIRDWISAIAEHQVDNSPIETHFIQSNKSIALEYQRNPTVNICQITEPSKEVMRSPQLYSYLNNNMAWPVVQKLQTRVAAVKA